MIFADLEDAITQRIKDRAGIGEGKLGYALNVGGYAGEFDSESDLEEARLKFPCARILMKEIGRGEDTGAGQKVPVTYTIFVLPILLIQIAATVFHLLSFFTSAVNMEMNLGHQVLASIFRQAI